MWGVSLTPPVLTLFLCGEFVLRIPCCIDFYARSFSYTSRARSFYFSYFFIWAVSFTHPVLVSFFFPGEFLLHIPCWIHSCVFFLSGESLLHIPCSLHFYLWSFSYTSHAGFTFLCGVSLTHPKLGFSVKNKTKLNLVSFSYTSRVGFFFCLGSFSYTSRDGLTFIWRVSLTHPMLALVFCGRFLLHILCWLKNNKNILKTFTHTSVRIHPCTLLKQRAKPTTHQT